MHLSAIGLIVKVLIRDLTMHTPVIIPLSTFRDSNSHKRYKVFTLNSSQMFYTKIKVNLNVLLCHCTVHCSIVLQNYKDETPLNRSMEQMVIVQFSCFLFYNHVQTLLLMKYGVHFS